MVYNFGMTRAADPITFSVPRDLLRDIRNLSGQLLDRLHDLLERNTQGDLSPTENAELETLVRMAQFSEIVSLALEAKSKP